MCPADFLRARSMRPYPSCRDLKDGPLFRRLLIRIPNQGHIGSRGDHRIYPGLKGPGLSGIQ